MAAGIGPGVALRYWFRESRYRADARNGSYYGLMQILPQTARIMGSSAGVSSRSQGSSASRTRCARR